MKKFILSDENVLNSYGFKVSTKGIDLKRFKKNPVMLAQHWNHIDALLGKWINIEKGEDGRLTAEAEFDQEDDVAKKVQGKVDRGYLKGVSIGISFNRDDMVQQPDGTFLLTKCELMEASICAIPSNAGALKLYAGDRLLDESEIQLALNDISTEFKKSNKNSNNMNKLLLSVAVLAALDLQSNNTAEGVDASLVDDRVLKLKSDLDKATGTIQTLKEANEKMTGQLASAQKEKVDNLIDTAIANGQLAATEKDSWTELATANFELAKKTLSTIPTKASLSASVANSGQPGQVSSLDDFLKLPLAQQLAFKAENSEAYKALFQ